MAASSILLHALFVLAAMVVVSSTTASSVVPVTTEHRDVDMTPYASSVEVPPNWEMYSCFLCTGRHPLLRHMCPVYWDECHLECWLDMPDAVLSPPAPPPPVPVQAMECYVIKVYESGRYVIVQRLNCDIVVKSGCFLTCGGGELDDQKLAMGTTAVPVPMPVPATMTRGPPSELCNSQVNALRAPPSSSSAAAAGVVVPAGGAH